jgi:hypothetical protein
MSHQATIQFRRRTQDGAVMDFGSIIQVLAGGYPSHPRVIVTAARRRPGAVHFEPIEGCYAIAYPSVDEQYPVVQVSGAKMQDAVTSSLMDNCREMGEQMARRAWDLIVQGEARVFPIRTPRGAMSLSQASPVRPRTYRAGDSGHGDNVTPFRRRGAAADPSLV